MTARRTGTMCFRLRADERGVSGVVAAALGVVLISILLTMVVTFWVPAWGYDNEVAHSRDILDSFGQLKSSVESRAVQGATNQTVTSSFTLGVGAVPLFGAETIGTLSYRYLEDNVTRFAGRLSDSTGAVNLSVAGAIRYQITNRYFDAQTFSYECGAVILDQSQGATVRLPPAFSLTNTSGGVLVTSTLVTLEGDAKTLSGVDPHTITTRLTVAHSQEFAWPGGTVLTFEVSTWYPQAWSRWFNNTALAARLNETAFNVSTQGTEAPWLVTFMVDNVTQLTTNSALVRVQLD